jgi:hypothetical protein
MVNREEGGAADDGAPAAPFAIQRAEEEAAEEIFLGEWGEADRGDGVGDAQGGVGHSSRLLSMSSAANAKWWRIAI